MKKLLLLLGIILLACTVILFQNRSEVSTRTVENPTKSPILVAPENSVNEEIWPAERKEIHSLKINEDDGNDLLNRLVEINAEWLPNDLIKIILDPRYSMKWRNYCVQHFSNILIKKPTPELLAMFTKLLDCDDRGIKEISIFSLARISKEHPSDKVISVLVNRVITENISGLKHSRLRLASIRAIAHLGQRDNDVNLIEIAKNTDETVSERSAAIDALGAIACAEAETALLELQEDKYGPIQMAARSALRRIHPLDSVVPKDSQNVETLTHALKHPHSQVRLEAARELRKYSATAAICIPNIELCLAQLNEASSEQDIVVFLELVRSFRTVAAPLAPQLAKLLEETCTIYKSKSKETVHRLRSYLIVTLSDLGSARFIMPHLIDAIANSDQDMQLVFASAAYAVSSLGKDGSVFSPLLTRALAPTFLDKPVALNEYRATLTPFNSTSARIEAVKAIASIGHCDDATKRLLVQLAKSSPSSDSGLPDWKPEVHTTLQQLKTRGG